MGPEKVSGAPGTWSVRSEISQLSDCPVEVNTGQVYDDRFQNMEAWKMSEGQIMRENGVYERLFRQKGEFPSYRLKQYLLTDGNLK